MNGAARDCGWGFCEEGGGSACSTAFYFQFPFTCINTSREDNRL